MFANHSKRIAIIGMREREIVERRRRRIVEGKLDRDWFCAEETAPCMVVAGVLTWLTDFRSKHDLEDADQSEGDGIGSKWKLFMCCAMAVYCVSYQEALE